jgi:hypothetical protein
VVRPILRLYVDSSVIGGCFDIEFESWSNRLFRLFRDKRVRLVVSEITLKELEAAPPKVRNLLKTVPEDFTEVLSLSPEAGSLALEYIREGALPVKSLADAQHIAIATIARVDVLISWNFKHIVNINRIHLYNSINIRYGYPVLEIRSPMEVLADEEEGSF